VNKTNTSKFHRTIGIDVGDRRSEICWLDDTGEVKQRRKVATVQAAVRREFERIEPARVVLEAGTHSPWMSRLLTELGHEVLVANPRQVPLIGTSIRKDDRRDAELLARLGRVDPKLLAPVRHRSAEAQRDRALLQVRHALIRVRTLLINQARGLAKSQGIVLPRCSTGAFPRKARACVPTEAFRGQEVLLEQIEQVTARVRTVDAQLAQMAERDYPQTKRLRQVTGVGPLTSLCFVLTLETPMRFAKSRSVGAYLGLCPRRRDSGEQHPELRISKAGDSFLRQLLIQCAHYILGPFGPDCDLRRFGARLIAQGGPRAKKRARVAVARKLSVLLLALWRSEADYEPLRQASKVAA
jgi:transposase